MHVHDDIQLKSPVLCRKLVLNIPHGGFSSFFFDSEGREGVEVANQAYLRATLLNRKHLPLVLQVICAAFSHDVQGCVLFLLLYFWSNHQQQEVVLSVSDDQIHMFPLFSILDPFISAAFSFSSLWLLLICQ